MSTYKKLLATLVKSTSVGLMAAGLMVIVNPALVVQAGYNPGVCRAIDTENCGDIGNWQCNLKPNCQGNGGSCKDCANPSSFTGGLCVWGGNVDCFYDSFFCGPRTLSNRCVPQPQCTCPGTNYYDWCNAAVCNNPQ